MPARLTLKKHDREVKAQFGAAIRIRRKQLDLTQEGLARRIRMHRTYLADVENGGRNVALAGIARIAEGLGLSLSQFGRLIERTSIPRAMAKR